MRWQNRAFLVLIFAAVGVGFAGGTLRTIGYVTCAVLALLVAASFAFGRRFAAQAWWRGAVDPIVLQSPFAQPWRVVAGGPDAGHNPSLSSSDRRYAYAFAPVDALADAEIGAPCDGSVAWTEDRPGRDAYVSIETSRGSVIVAQLSSVNVRVADSVRSGTPIGRWSGAQLVQVYAQDRPQVAPDIARAIPIAFWDRNGVAQVLEYGDVLEPALPAQNERQAGA